MRFYGWTPYVSVAERRAKAAKHAKKAAKKGKNLSPVTLSSQKIASTFWGKAWCENLEKYCDASNRLPRGRTYVRNGSVIDLKISSGKIESLVSGSSIYRIEIKISTMPKSNWKQLCGSCASEIGSLIDLMRGRLSHNVIARITNPKDGLFPKTNEIKLSCSCPDGVSMCKHVAATLYGVGNRLDSQPELLFLLRGVDQAELVSHAMKEQDVSDAIGLNTQSSLEEDDLGALFGIELAEQVGPSTEQTAKPEPKRKKAANRSKQVDNPVLTSKPSQQASAKKSVAKKSVTKSSVKNAKPAVTTKLKVRDDSTAKKNVKAKLAREPESEVVSKRVSKPPVSKRVAKTLDNRLPDDSPSEELSFGKSSTAIPAATKKAAKKVKKTAPVAIQAGKSSSTSGKISEALSQADRKPVRSPKKKQRPSNDRDRK